jgi:hypothetical protein
MVIKGGAQKGVEIIEDILSGMGRCSYTTSSIPRRTKERLSDIVEEGEDWRTVPTGCSGDQYK